MPAYSDEQLVLEALDDSHPAFEQLVKQHQYRVLRTIASIISDEQAAQDVAQETFLLAWSNLEKLRDRHKFGGWLNQIAINASKLWLKDQNKYSGNTVSLEEDVLVLTQELSYQREKLRQEVWDAIDGLPEDHREVVILHYISGYSYREISEMLAVPFSTTVGRIQQARNQLRKEFLDMVTQLQLEIDSTVHRFLKEHAKQDGLSIEGLIVQLIERYKMDMDSPGGAVRKVADRVAHGGRPSPNGRYLSMADQKTGNLAIRDLTTGEIRDITNDAQREPDQRCQYAERRSIWSPDGKQIAYQWFNEDHYELRIIGLDGSEPRVLVSDVSPCVWPTYSLNDWSQDGTFILAQLIRPDRGIEVVRVSAVDGSIQTLKSTKNHHPFDMRLSTDGRHALYPCKDTREGTSLLATDGSGEEKWIQGTPDGWDTFQLMAPDGETIVFTSITNSDPVGGMSLWAMQVVDGKQMGEPRLVTRAMGGIYAQKFTPKGSLYYATISGVGSTLRRADIYLASLDMETGEILSSPILLRSDGNNNAPAWSPDGKSLAYSSVRHPSDGTGYGTALVIRSMEAGEEREIFQDRKRFSVGQEPYFQWSPDGRSILYGDRIWGGFDLVDAQTGQSSTIVDWRPMGGKPALWGDHLQRIKACDAAWSRDGKMIFYIRIHEEQRNQYSSIVAHDVATGTEQELCPGGTRWGKNLIVSPDGQQLVFADDERRVLKVIPTAGGQPRIIINLHDRSAESKESIFPIMWEQDGRHILAQKIRWLSDWSKAGPPELWRIPVEEGEPEKLWEVKEPLMELQGLGFHPDGQRIAYSKRSGDEDSNIELWVMENFLNTFAPDK
ncbi:sigma-70 family RNA polymerase sigma factor [Candidatus Poribacteria bacterium]